MHRDTHQPSKPAKLPLLLGCLSLCLSMAACGSSEVKDLTEDSYRISNTVGNRGSIRYFQIVLTKDQTFNKIAFKSGQSLQIYKEQGTLQSVITREPLTLNGIEFPMGTRLEFRPTGQLRSAYVIHPTTVGKATYDTDTAFGFDFNGRLEWIDLKQKQTIQRWPCILRVRFHPNGRLAGTNVARSLKYQGVVLYTGDEVSLYPNGRLQEVVATKHRVIQGFPCHKNAAIGFYEDGKLKTLMLSRDHKFKGKVYDEKKVLELNKKGEIVVAKN